jgi:CheY-like chemotaxis protein
MHLRLLELIDNWNYIQVMVVDTGIGIRAEKLETIFESFQQESAETTRKYGGTGLGLSISKQLIELQKGKISVQSKVGEGSIFTFIIPFKISEIEMHEKSEEKVTNSMLQQLAKMHVLLAEDNKLNQLVATEMLKKYKVKCTVASDGGETIDRLNEQKFDAILLDLHMPVKDGFEVAKYISADCELNKNINIIALTAAATKVEVDKSFSVGMNKFISKPFTDDDLISALVDYSNTSAIAPKEEQNSVSSESLTNLSYLKTMSGGNVAIIKEMVGLFKEQIPQYISELQDAKEKKDYHRLSEQAHKTKSSLTIVGMNSLAKEMKSLELKAKNEEDIESYDELIDNFIKQINIGIIELNKRIELLS